MKMSYAKHDVSSDEEEVSEFESDDEDLQEAFASGKIKPGSLVVLNKSGKIDESGGEEDKFKPINDRPLLQLKLEKIQLPKSLNWVERLDVVNDVAPLAPEIALQLEEHKGKRAREIKLINAQRKKKTTVPQPSLKSVDEDVVHNDFVREMSFYRQAQQAVLKCLPRLKEMGVPTKRPDDYFAEMAKSDTHMQKVAQVLLKKQTATERAEKSRKLRDQKKFAKQTQIQVIQERHKAKKEMLDSVKKYRSGQKNSLDFLDDDKGGKNKGKKETPGKKSPRGAEPRVNRRRLVKNEKYGYGGKKKGSKWNTRDSLDNFDDGKKGKGGAPTRVGGRGGGRGGGRSPGGRGGPGSSNKGSFGGAKRPGKQSRQRIKARGK